MNYTVYEHDQIGDFLQDDSFILAAKNKSISIENWNRLLDLNSEKRDLMEDASLLINFLEFKPVLVPEKIIEEDFSQFQNKLRFIRRTKKFALWMSVAASVISVFFVGKYLISDHLIAPSGNNPISLLSEVNTDKTSILLNIGDGQLISIDKNRTVVEQEKDGGLSVNGGKIQIKNEDITVEDISLSVPYGRLMQLRLNDGTIIWANSGTKLSFPKKFDKKSREIYVEGEVYAEIKPDKSKPFFVKTEKIEVKVLGTSFNLNSYKDNPFSEVVLVKGKVEVKAQNKTNILSPGESLKSDKDNVSISHGVDTDAYTCWKDDVIKLNKEPLSVVLKKLARRYNADIQFEGKDISSSYDGKMVLTDSLTEVLDNLALMDPITYKVEKKSIIVSLK